jgi:TPP-dependent pyruvate/acetoin dehydrogenase alpha subunit
MERIDGPKAFEIYRKLVEIRKFEEKIFELFMTRPMPGSMHQCNGQEAVPVGVCSNLGKNDFITGTHRGHGHSIAKGADIQSLMAEIFAKKTGCSKGMGGSMHLTDMKNGVIGTNGIVAGGIPMAVGAGWTCKYFKNNHVAVSFFGDGASNEGAFHESLNLAAAWKLPVIFICENNLYGYTTHYKKTMAIDDIAVRAGAYGMPGIIADGMDVTDVYKKVGEAVDGARIGNGPALIECKTYRYRGHSRFEKPGYRTDEELEAWKKRDPIVLFKAFIVDNLDIPQDKLAAIDSAVAAHIEEAVMFAEESPETDPDDYKKYIYA